MTLTADAFEQASQLKRAQCSLVTIYAALSPKDRRELEAAMARPPDVVTHAGIAKVLRAAGHRIDGQTISRHRRGLCSCPERTT
jgi:hypothetical protein